MAERVLTGGTKSFEYSGRDLKLDEERKLEIQKGYNEYYERKKREKRNRMVKIIVLILIVLIILTAIFLRSS